MSPPTNLDASKNQLFLIFFLFPEKKKSYIGPSYLSIQMCPNLESKSQTLAKQEMKLNIFGLFLFILFAQSLWRAASESSFKPNNQEFKLSNSLAQRQDVQRVKQNFTGQVGKDDKVTKYEKNENLVYSMKAKGKGAFGGANVVHRPRDTKNMAALGSTNPSPFTTIIFASLTLGWSFGYGCPI